MTEHRYTTLWELFLAVSAHAKQNHCDIIAADEPKNMLFGWGCPATDTYFRLRLVDVKNRKALAAPEKVKDLILKLMMTMERRKHLIILLNIGFTNPDEMLRAYDRLCGLSAFW